MVTKVSGLIPKPLSDAGDFLGGENLKNSAKTNTKRMSESDRGRWGPLPSRSIQIAQKRDLDNFNHAAAKVNAAEALPLYEKNLTNLMNSMVKNNYRRGLNQVVYEAKQHGVNVPPQAMQMLRSKPAEPQSEREEQEPYRQVPGERTTISQGRSWIEERVTAVTQVAKGLGEGFKFGDGNSYEPLQRPDANNKKSWRDANQGDGRAYGVGGRLRIAADVVPFVSSFTNYQTAQELRGDRPQSARDPYRMNTGASKHGTARDMHDGGQKAKDYGISADQLAKKSKDDAFSDVAMLGASYIGGPLLGKGGGALLKGVEKYVKGAGTFIKDLSTTTRNAAPAARGATTLAGQAATPAATGGMGAAVPKSGLVKTVSAAAGKQALKQFDNGEKLADASGPVGTAAGLYYLSMKAKLGEVGVTTSDKLPGVKQKVSAIMNENGAENTAIGAAPQVVIYTTKPGSKQADNYFVAAMGGSVAGSKIYRVNDLIKDAKEGRIKSLETYIDWGKANMIVQSLAKKQQVGLGERATVANGATGYVAVTFGPPDANTRWKVSGGLGAVNATGRVLANYGSGAPDGKRLTGAPLTAQPYINVYNSLPGNGGVKKPNVGPVQYSVQSGFFGPGGVAGYSTSTQPLKRGFNIDIGSGQGSGKKIGFRGENSAAGSVKAFTMTINGNKRTLAIDQIMKRDFPSAAKEVNGQLGGFTSAVLDAQKRVLLKSK